ncbi:hypothetical protein [Spiroplasma endosymbiont of Apeira syringaria]|uniref:hypothetical protein n=1 Tax=Spiroplasma endosymbiont of Apeira syringaria TaxID=3066307 RepID=UPI0030CAEC69
MLKITFFIIWFLIKFKNKNIRIVLIYISSFLVPILRFIKNIIFLILFKAFLPLCTILILSHKCWEKPIYGLLPTFLNQT